MLLHAPQPGHRALRKGRVSLPGHGYLLTIVCEKRAPRFSDSRCAEAVTMMLSEHRLWRDHESLCWVLMPDHLHALLILGQSESLSRLVNRIKSVTALAANRAIGREDRLWMRGYHDRALRKEDDTLTAARYVLGNPIRAGLVEDVLSYPYWSCAWSDFVLTQ